MPLSILFSRALTGVRATSVTVEVHLAGGLPHFNIVGLPDTEVREARERVRAAIVNARFEFPARRITVNLAPADLPKEGGRYDLPIALGILAASGQIDNKQMRGVEFAGELSLDGKLRDCGGALPITLAARADERMVILPPGDAAVGALANGAMVYAAQNLPQVCAHLCGRDKLPRAKAAPMNDDEDNALCISAVKRQEAAKRALAVAAAGGHSVLMIGPPGSGKSMLAARFNGLMPPLTEAEALETAAVHSLGGKSFNPDKWRKRPYRAPHHSASAAALVGGGSRPRPGEISLAHNGVLFLDELPEFERPVLEVLREPLESGCITISRAARQADFPAAFQLLAAMNPCPCGYLGHENGKCRCTPNQIERYRSRISGPILDRIDMHLEVSALSEKELTEKPANSTSSKQVREQSTAARQFQYQRQNNLNARLTPGEVDRYCIPDEKAQQYIKRAISSLSLSARAYHRILRVARTIADLAQAEDIGAAHAGEAIQYRRPIFASSRA
ncbi:MAG: YifB family Mg chelatase-like AAA ATPase [Gammaproteobacteria bacterium]